MGTVDGNELANMHDNSQELDGSMLACAEKISESLSTFRHNIEKLVMVAKSNYIREHFRDKTIHRPQIASGGGLSWIY